MAYKLTAKPNDKVDLWWVFMDGRLVTTFNRDGEALLTLGSGDHRLTYEIHGPGGTLKLDIAEEPPIFMPPNATGPVTGAVPANETGFVDAVYFRT